MVRSDYLIKGCGTNSRGPRSGRSSECFGTDLRGVALGDAAVVNGVALDARVPIASRRALELRIEFQVGDGPSNDPTG